MMKLDSKNEDVKIKIQVQETSTSMINLDENMISDKYATTLYLAARLKILYRNKNILFLPIILLLYMTRRTQQELQMLFITHLGLICNIRTRLSFHIHSYHIDLSISYQLIDKDILIQIIGWMRVDARKWLKSDINFG